MPIRYCESRLSNSKGNCGNNSNIMEQLQRKALEWKCSVNSREFAIKMDMEDPLKDFRKKFYYPKKKTLTKVDMSLEEDPEAECIYLCGHSLGLQPKSTQSYIQHILDDWANLAVEGHQNGWLPFAQSDIPLKGKMARIVGAYPSEVALLNGLTVNLHILLATFYTPTPKRHKILIEEYTFPSDMHVAVSQITFHGYTVEESLLMIKPRQGEYLLRTEDIVKVIEEHGDSIAVILLPGVQFYTGQVLDVKTITDAGHKKNCLVGFDLAHTVGNVPVELHNWDVDFAAWCTYKYLCSGAGGIAGIYVHERFTKETTQDFPRLRGWWGVKSSVKFITSLEFQHSDGANMFRLSNPPPLLMCTLLASLDIIEEAKIEKMMEKQLLLTGFLESLINDFASLCEGENGLAIKIISPSNPKERGSQLSVLFTVPNQDVKTELERRGVVLDMRNSIIRLSPVPLYNSYLDVYKFMEALKDIYYKGKCKSPVNQPNFKAS